MKSMTGFGHGTATGTKGIVTAEIKTVNNRFLELNIRTDHFFCSRGRKHKIFNQRTGTPGQDIR